MARKAGWGGMTGTGPGELGRRLADLGREQAQPGWRSKRVREGENEGEGRMGGWCWVLVGPRQARPTRAGEKRGAGLEFDGGS